jgi:hypothetical protein
MRQTLSVATLALAALISVTATEARAQADIEVGVLNCAVSGGAGFVIGSSKRLECVFQSGDRREPYFGRINKFGLDVGVTSTGVIAWAVFAPTRDIVSPGVLAGGYAGITGEATVGVGVGANALVGGSRRSFTLQPLSVGAQQGLNLAVGVASLTLEPGY